MNSFRQIFPLILIQRLILRSCPLIPSRYRSSTLIPFPGSNWTLALRIHRSGLGPNYTPSWSDNWSENIKQVGEDLIYILLGESHSGIKVQSVCFGLYFTFSSVLQLYPVCQFTVCEAWNYPAFFTLTRTVISVTPITTASSQGSDASLRLWAILYSWTLFKNIGITSTVCKGCHQEPYVKQLFMCYMCYL